jgi:periplasmic divalent cation tolerance protein
MLVILTTAPDIWEAESLAEKIVQERLAACVQVMPQMTSFYFWEGEIQKEGEHLLLIKTLEEKFDALRQFIAMNHSYEVPEIVALNSEQASGPYVEWINSYVNGAAK